MKTMRASILVLGPLVARFGEARVSLPGGCAIGQRPVDQHIKGLQAMGAHDRHRAGLHPCARAARLKGARIVMDLVTVTGTENLMMAAAWPKARRCIENAAREPEVVDLAECLNAMGAQIQGAGTRRDHHRRRGRAAWRDAIGSCRTASRPARSSCAAAATGGDVKLKGTRADILDAVHRASCAKPAPRSSSGDDWIRLSTNGALKSVNLRTAPYPAFPTDMQAQFMALNSVAEGTAVVTETIFENRFMHVQELRRLGAQHRSRGQHRDRARRRLT